MRIVEVDRPGPMLDRVYREVLSPSFPPAEMCAVTGMAAGLGGVTTVTVVVDDADRPVAAAVGDWSAASRIQLLSYLAVVPEHRGSGLGGRLLRHVLDDWRARYRPCAVVAEIEHPAMHGSSPAHGDPAARVRFYARHGALALDVPYFQPALRPQDGRYHGMILISLHCDPELAGAAPGSLAGAALREFMVEYLAMAEGEVAGDPATTALLAAFDRPAGVPTYPLDELDRIPVSAR